MVSSRQRDIYSIGQLVKPNVGITGFKFSTISIITDTGEVTKVLSNSLDLRKLYFNGVQLYIVVSCDFTYRSLVLKSVKINSISI